MQRTQIKYKDLNLFNKWIYIGIYIHELSHLAIAKILTKNAKMTVKVFELIQLDRIIIEIDGGVEINYKSNWIFKLIVIAPLLFAVLPLIALIAFNVTYFWYLLYVIFYFWVGPSKEDLDDLGCNFISKQHQWWDEKVKNVLYKVYKLVRL